MYNLIVLPKTYEWNKDYANIKKERFLEYTDANLIEEHRELDAKTIAYLQSIPTIFASEMGNAHLGEITNIEERRGEIRFYYQIDQKYKPIQLIDLTTRNFDFDTHNYELSRSHWAIKGIDLMKALKLTSLLRLSDIQDCILQPEDKSASLQTEADVSTVVKKVDRIDWQTTAAKATIVGVGISAVFGVLALFF